MPQKDAQVLVVEDNDLLRKGLVEFLNHCEGIVAVGSASSGEEAIAVCAELLLDVVLMDLALPGMDGVRATREICQKYPHIQVVVLTGSYLGNRREEVLAAGAYAYLEKAATITLEGIADIIREAAQQGSS